MWYIDKNTSYRKEAICLDFSISSLNAPALYLISGIIILGVAIVSILFMVRAWRAGIAIGMDRKKLRRAVTSSATFTLLPSISILLGVIALSGTLGTPLPWLRLSVIGALHYEASVADIAARNIGMNGLNAAEMTASAFTTIALLMTAGIIWGMVCMLFFGKRYCNRLQKPRPSTGKSGAGFGDLAMKAMFIGLISAYIGSYIGGFVSLPAHDYMPLIVMAASALSMAVFLHFVEKKKLTWLDNFSMAGSMLISMAVAVLVGLLV